MPQSTADYTIVPLALSKYIARLRSCARTGSGQHKDANLGEWEAKDNDDTQWEYLTLHLGQEKLTQITTNRDYQTKDTINILSRLVNLNPEKLRILAKHVITRDFKFLQDFDDLIILLEKLSSELLTFIQQIKTPILLKLIEALGLNHMSDIDLTYTITRIEITKNRLTKNHSSFFPTEKSALNWLVKTLIQYNGLTLEDICDMNNKQLHLAVSNAPPSKKLTFGDLAHLKATTQLIKKPFYAKKEVHSPAKAIAYGIGSGLSATLSLGAIGGLIYITIGTTQTIDIGIIIFLNIVCVAMLTASAIGTIYLGKRCHHHRQGNSSFFLSKQKKEKRDLADLDNRESSNNETKIATP